MNQTKYIFVTGGALSLGKGNHYSFISKIVKVKKRYRTTIQKFDPYNNVDPGTPTLNMANAVTDDHGVETDLDLGHYERFFLMFYLSGQ
jgi:CTP synthase